MRIYKTIRLAYETKQWIDELIYDKTQQLNKNMRENALQERLEDQLSLNEELNGISVNISLNVTIGSIIEQATRYCRTFSLDDWQSLQLEVESAKAVTKDGNQSDATPRLYISKSIYEELEGLQIKLRGNGARVPRMSYIIKLVVYALYQNLS